MEWRGRGDDFDQGVYEIVLRFPNPVAENSLFGKTRFFVSLIVDHPDVLTGISKSDFSCHQHLHLKSRRFKSSPL